jgi:hypothetical protein
VLGPGGTVKPAGLAAVLQLQAQQAAPAGGAAALGERSSGGGDMAAVPARQRDTRSSVMLG